LKVDIKILLYLENKNLEKKPEQTVFKLETI